MKVEESTLCGLMYLLILEHDDGIGSLRQGFIANGIVRYFNKLHRNAQVFYTSLVDAELFSEF